MGTTYKLSPSDLTFLWDECPRCFYLKVKQKFGRPSTPFPSIFTRIDGLMKSFYQGALAQEMSAELQDSTVRCEECWVTSQVTQLPGHNASFYIKGKLDALVEFSDGSYGIVDFKTSQAKEEHVSFYGRQLHAYAYALEHPAPGALCLKPVTRLGLLCAEPVLMERTQQGDIAYIVNSVWKEIPKQEQGFLSFIDSVLGLLECDEPPPPAKTCNFCKYRQSGYTSGF
jgi:hypothetical protein